ncbi:MAG: enoyl-CoA hydratase/isomerase family protein [Pseudomonadota bacterium]
MNDIDIRIIGRAGRITLNRPDALNALTYEMCLAIEEALDAWRADEAVALVVIDAAGARAFCAGGDIVEMYRTGRAGDFEYGRRFWADEYRLNAKIHTYPKPYIAFMQGFTMGGGVGISCHGSHRIVGETSRIAMPECGIGLVPDVGGSYLLARAPGRVGEYLGTTGHRMGPGCAIFAGFADRFIAEMAWPDLIAELEATGSPACLEAAATQPPDSELAAQEGEIDGHFGATSLSEALSSLDRDRSEFSAKTRQALAKGSPLAMACAHDLIGRVRGASGIERALEMEYRFTYRAAEEGDFLEGIRAAIIDKDRRPNWLHSRPEDVTRAEIARMLAPLGANRLSLKGGAG